LQVANTRPYATLPEPKASGIQRLKSTAPSENEQLLAGYLNVATAVMHFSEISINWHIFAGVIARFSDDF
jgi:hypothetical protein